MAVKMTNDRRVTRLIARRNGVLEDRPQVDLLRDFYGFHVPDGVLQGVVAIMGTLQNQAVTVFGPIIMTARIEVRNAQYLMELVFVAILLDKQSVAFRIRDGDAGFGQGACFLVLSLTESQLGQLGQRFRPPRLPRPSIGIILGGSALVSGRLPCDAATVMGHPRFLLPRVRSVGPFGVHRYRIRVSSHGLVGGREVIK